MNIVMIMKRTGMALALLSLVSACSFTSKPKEVETNPNVQASIDSAKAANERARGLGFEWRDTARVIEEAETAATAGEDDEAIRLANKARRQAENAIQQAELNVEEPAPIEEPPVVEEVIEEAPIEEEVVEASTAVDYEILHGDTLWGISASSEFYGDPFQWPLIYKYNQAQINDPDLIYPGQVFQVEMSPDGDAIDAAVSHARNRGEWAVGVVEQSDQDYLSQ